MVSEPGFHPVYTPAHMKPSSAAIDIVQRTENMIFDRTLNQRKLHFFQVRQTAEICRWLAESFDARAVELLIGDIANSKRPLFIIPKVQLRLRVTRRSATALACTRRSWQKLFAGKNLVKSLVNAQTQLRSYSEQQRTSVK